MHARRPLRARLRSLRRLRRLGRLRHLAEPGLPTLRAASWAILALRRLRREIPDAGLDVRVLAPPRATPGGIRGVEAALRMRHATCLERSLIVQRWLMAVGSHHDVLIGVGRDADTIDAHAWIHRYDPDAEGEGLQLLSRVAPRL
jgi:hypothetical protein